jgi:phosphatidylglycerophosphate synthase
VSSGFWAGYWQSLKSLDVEEPIDVWVHRPLAYVLARALLPTPISPNLVTLGSIGCGVYAGYLMLLKTPHHFQWAALCAFGSTVLDCADGQLARLRKTSSVFGRMLDGSADLIVSSAILSAGGWWIYSKYSARPWLALLVMTLMVVAAVTTSIQTTLFDHYKTVFMKLTVPGFREAESWEDVKRRYAAQREFTLVTRVTWAFYRFFIYNQSNAVRSYDPNTVSDYASLGEHEAGRAAIYRAESESVMRTWRRYFGFGSLMFGITLALLFEVPDYYLLFRLTLLNLVFYGPLRARQRRASARAFAALAAAGSAAAPAN